MAIIRCVNPNCSHEFQDTKYGKGIRVMNGLSKQSSHDHQRYRCSVCATVQFENDGKELKRKLA